MLSRLLAACAVLATACARDADESRVTTRDSNRIRIVESRAPAWTGSQVWHVDSAPLVSIGATDGPAEYLLDRVGGVVRLPDGRIVIGDGGSGQLRFYDSTGTFLHAIGRKGRGPGEFGESLMRVWRASRGDFFVTDNDNARINVFSEAGWFMRAVHLARLEHSPSISAMDLFDDGTILATVNPSSSDSAVQGDNRLEYPDILYLQFAEDGRLLSHILRTRGSSQYVYRYEGSMRRSLLPFGTTDLHAVVGDALAFSTGAQSEVSLWSPHARDPQGIFRWNRGPGRRVADVWERYQEASMEQVAPTRRHVHRYFLSLDLPLPEFVPSVERLLGDADGNLWARHYRLPWEPAQEWDVLAPGGDWLGTVSTPSGLNVEQIGTDFVLGIHRDDLGIERVRMHRLSKPVDRSRMAVH